MVLGTDKQDRKATAATPSQGPSKTRRVLGFFTPDLGSGPAQVRETHGIFLQILASLFFSVGILPREHPYLQPGTKFSIGELFATTLAKIDWKNKQQLPQTVFFCAVWGLLVSTVLYVVTAVLLFVATPSHAYAQDATPTGTAATSSGMFSVPADDLAQQFLHNLVEGKPITAIQGQNTEGTTQSVDGGILQGAFRDMLKYYSSVILIIASFMVLYHIIMLIVNSAWSGKPLEGANQIWGPLRLAIAIGLLVPLSGGLNSGQYAVLKIAEVGSAAGTKAWNIFSTRLADRSGKLNLAQNDEIRNEFVKMILVHVCKIDINSHAGGNPINMVYERPTIKSLLGFGIAASNSEASLIYGQKATKFSTFLNFIYCGEITFPDTNLKDDSSMILAGGNSATTMNQLSKDIRQVAFDASSELDKQAATLAKDLVNLQAGYEGDADRASAEMLADPKADPLITKIKLAIDGYYAQVDKGVANVISKNQSWKFLEQTSWVMAGAYYAQVSAYQNTVFSAASTGPKVELGPIFAKRPSPEGLIETIKNAFSTNGSAYATPEENHFVSNLGIVYAPLVKQAIFEDRKSANNPNLTNPPTENVSGSLVGKLSSAITMNKDTFINNFKDGAADPFAAFVNAGHYVLSSGLKAFVAGLAFLVGAEFQGSIPIIGGGSTATVGLASWIMTFSIYLISIGALLCLVLPLVPVIKFLGGVITWMLAVLEAVIGMPLFALAHLTPGGQGLLDPARQGYIMLFHIAIRPMLIVFGMIVAIIIVTPAILLLNSVFLPAMNSAWQPDDGGLIQASLMLGLWAFFAYGILKKIFGFQDYLSHATMRWLGGNGYQFERYQGEHNAFAAIAAFDKVTGTAGKFIETRQKAALEKLKPDDGGSGGGGGGGLGPKYMPGGIAGAGGGITSGGPGFGGGGSGTAMRIGSSTAGKKGAAPSSGIIGAAPKNAAGRAQSYGFGAGDLARDAGSRFDFAKNGESLIKSKLTPDGKVKPKPAGDEKDSIKRRAALGIAALGAGALATGGVGGGKATAATLAPATTAASTIATVIPGATLTQNLKKPAGSPADTAGQSGSSTPRAGISGKGTVSESASQQVAAIDFTRSNAGGIGGASTPSGTATPGATLLQNQQRPVGALASVAGQQGNSTPRPGLSGTAKVGGSAAQQVAGINFNRPAAGNAGGGSPAQTQSQNQAPALTVSGVGAARMAAAPAGTGGYTAGTTKASFGGGAAATTNETQLGGGFGDRLEAGAPLPADIAGSAGTSYINSASDAAPAPLADYSAGGLGVAQDGGAGGGSFAVGAAGDDASAGAYSITSGETQGISGGGMTLTGAADNASSQAGAIDNGLALTYPPEQAGQVSQNLQTLGLDGSSNAADVVASYAAIATEYNPNQFAPGSAQHAVAEQRMEQATRSFEQLQTVMQPGSAFSNPNVIQSNFAVGSPTPAAGTIAATPSPLGQTGTVNSPILQSGGSPSATPSPFITTPAPQAVAPGSYNAPPQSSPLTQGSTISTPAPQTAAAPVTGGQQMQSPITTTLGAVPQGSQPQSSPLTQGVTAAAPAAAPTPALLPPEGGAPTQAPVVTQVASNPAPTGAAPATAALTPAPASAATTEVVPAPTGSDRPRNVAGVDLNIPSSAASFTERLAEIEAAGGADPTKPKGKGKKGKQGLGSA